MLWNNFIEERINRIIEILEIQKNWMKMKMGEQIVDIKLKVINLKYHSMMMMIDKDDLIKI